MLDRRIAFSLRSRNQTDSLRFDLGVRRALRKGLAARAGIRIKEGQPGHEWLDCPF